MRRIKRMAELCFAIVIGSLAGCGKPTGKVSGNVSFQGKPVAYGSVTLMGQDGLPIQAQIHSDGRFSLENVPLGLYKVVVSTGDFDTEGKLPQSRSGAKPGRKQDTPKPQREKKAPDGWVPIPKKYSKVEESNLAVEVTKHATVFDITLIDDEVKPEPLPDSPDS